MGRGSLMSENTCIKRATVKLKRPNPLFEKWLREWQEEAMGRNSDLQYTFGKALESLQKYPIALNSGKECLILEHFDTQLCTKLDRRLVEHRKNELATNGNIISTNGQASSTLLTKPSSENSKGDGSLNNQETKNIKGGPKTKKVTQGRGKRKNEDLSDVPKEVNSRSKKPYMPTPRSGTYAILITLFNKEKWTDYVGYMTKVELQREAQPLCDSSFSRPLPGSFFTAWSSMSKLVTKGYVKKCSNPAKFSLTKEGRELCEKLLQADNSSEPSSSSIVPPLVPPGVSRSEVESLLAPVKRGKKKDTESLDEDCDEEESESQNYEPLVFLPGSFEIYLLVDTAETNGGLRKEDDMTIRELTKSGVTFEVRHLKIGDFAWVCRHRQSKEELVLPYILERKRLDDLSKSIKDGRFHEQKFRLKQCGLTNLMYLVEIKNRLYTGLPISSLQQAVINTHVADKFTVKLTNSHKESMKYLATLTTIFTNLFQNKTLISCKKDELDSSKFKIEDDMISLMTFKDFSFGMGKNERFTVREMFVKQLVQLHGVSAEKAWAISERYPTPGSLGRACLASHNPAFLSDIPFGNLNRRIGPAISNSLHAFFTKHPFPSS